MFIVPGTEPLPHWFKVLYGLVRLIFLGAYFGFFCLYLHKWLARMFHRLFRSDLE